jgi:hypothetical protein
MVVGLAVMLARRTASSALPSPVPATITVSLSETRWLSWAAISVYVVVRLGDTVLDPVRDTSTPFR